MTGSESGLAGAAGSGISLSVSCSPLSLIFRFGFLAHLDGRSVEALKPGDGAEHQTNDRQPAMRSELGVEPAASEEADKDRQDEVKADRSIAAQAAEIASQRVSSSGIVIRFFKIAYLSTRHAEKPRSPAGEQ